MVVWELKDEGMRVLKLNWTERRRKGDKGAGTRRKSYEVMRTRRGRKAEAMGTRLEEKSSLFCPCLPYLGCRGNLLFVCEASSTPTSLHSAFASC